MRSGYSLSIFWSEDDGGFIALIPEFPGLSAFGETREEAAKEAEIALVGMIASYKEDGETLPMPKELQVYSGQFRLRIAPSLHQAAALEAQRENVSMNALVSTALAYYLGEKRQENAVISRLEKLQETLNLHDKTLEKNTQNLYLQSLHTMHISDIPVKLQGPPHLPSDAVKISMVKQ